MTTEYYYYKVKNQDFRKYVQKYATTRNITIKEALKHALTKEYMDELEYKRKYGDQLRFI